MSVAGVVTDSDNGLALGFDDFPTQPMDGRAKGEGSSRLAWRTSTFASRIEGFLRVSRGGGWRLKRSELVQDGTPEELRERQGGFRTLWRMQAKVQTH
jgi:hypothetical protein